MIHAEDPALLDYNALDQVSYDSHLIFNLIMSFFVNKQKDRRGNMEMAFSIFERTFGVPQFVDAADVLKGTCDSKALSTYIATCIQAFKEYHKGRGTTGRHNSVCQVRPTHAKKYSGSGREDNRHATMSDLKGLQRLAVTMDNPDEELNKFYERSRKVLIGKDRKDSFGKRSTSATQLRTESFEEEDGKDNDNNNNNINNNTTGWLPARKSSSKSKKRQPIIFHRRSVGNLIAEEEEEEEKKAASKARKGVIGESSGSGTAWKRVRPLQFRNVARSDITGTSSSPSFADSPLSPTKGVLSPTGTDSKGTLARIRNKDSVRRSKSKGRNNILLSKLLEPDVPWWEKALERLPEMKRDTLRRNYAIEDALLEFECESEKQEFEREIKKVPEGPEKEEKRRRFEWKMEDKVWEREDKRRREIFEKELETLPFEDKEVRKTQFDWDEEEIVWERESERKREWLEAEIEALPDDEKEVKRKKFEENEEEIIWEREGVRRKRALEVEIESLPYDEKEVKRKEFEENEEEVIWEKEGAKRRRALEVEVQSLPEEEREERKMQFEHDEEEIVWERESAKRRRRHEEEIKDLPPIEKEAKRVEFEWEEEEKMLAKVAEGKMFAAFGKSSARRKGTEPPALVVTLAPDVQDNNNTSTISPDGS